MTETVEILKNKAEIKVGYQARTAIRNDPDGTHRLIQGKDFDSMGFLQMDKLLKFFPERNPLLYIVDKGDVLLQARGIEHTAKCITQPMENTLAAGTFYILRSKNSGIRPEFLAWWINQPPSQAYLKSQAVGSGISFISKHTVAHIPVIMPSLAVQDKILKVAELWQREQYLQKRLMACKNRFINAVCLKSIERDKEINQ